jgi:hypothetical protein
VGLALTGCATLREVAALREVEFSLTGVSDGALAGVPITSMRSVEELGATDLLRVGAAIARKELPLEAVLLVDASNPADNAQARLVGLDWTLYLENRETVSGILDREYVLPPGEPVAVPVRVHLDLLEFFDGGLEEMVGLALALAGAGEPTSVRLDALPSIETPLGPIRYPRPVRIETEVGSIR